MVPRFSRLTRSVCCRLIGRRSMGRPIEIGQGARSRTFFFHPPQTRCRVNCVDGRPLGEKLNLQKPAPTEEPCPISIFSHFSRP